MAAKQVLLSIAVIFFVVGLVLMAVAEHVYNELFIAGFALLMIAIIIFITSIFWKVATSLDDFIADHCDKDDKKN